MNTRVELRINGKITSAITKEVRALTKMNTPNKREINICRDKIDDNLLIIRFESYPGRSDGIAGAIMKSYSLNLDSYSDISVMFKTKRNDLSRTTDRITKKEVVGKIKEYVDFLDKKDWGNLQLLFYEKFEYSEWKEGSEQMGRAGKKTSLKQFLKQKEKNAKEASANHEIFIRRLSKEGRIIRCEVDYLIQMGNGKQNVTGKQEFEMVLIENELKISKLTDKRLT